MESTALLRQVSDTLLIISEDVPPSLSHPLHPSPPPSPPPHSAVSKLAGSEQSMDPSSPGQIVSTQVRLISIGGSQYLGTVSSGLS